MTTAADLFSDLRRAGFLLRRDGGQLLVSPASRLTPEQRSVLQERKPELLELLAQADAMDRLAASGWQPDWNAGPCQAVSVTVVDIIDRLVAVDPVEHDRLTQAIARHNAEAARCQAAPPAKRKTKRSLFGQESAA